MASLPHRGQWAGLRRRLLALTDRARERASERQTLRQHADALPVLRPALARAGIDPAQIRQMYRFTGAEKELARIGDSSEKRRADADFIAAIRGTAPADHLAAAAARRAPRFIGDGPPDPDAWYLDWYAWALAQEVPPPQPSPASGGGKGGG